MIGETMFVSGIAMFVCAPDRRPHDGQGRPAHHAGVRVHDLRRRVLADDLSDQDFGFWQIFMPQVLRGVGLMFAMVPITNLALGTLPPERLKNASGLFNLTRNLGGALRIAALNTVLDDRMDLHFARLHESVKRGAASRLTPCFPPDPAVLRVRRRARSPWPSNR